MITDEQVAAMKATFAKLGKDMAELLKISVQCPLCGGWIAHGVSYNDHAKTNHTRSQRLREWIARCTR